MGKVAVLFKNHRTIHVWLEDYSCWISDETGLILNKIDEINTDWSKKSINSAENGAVKMIDSLKKKGWKIRWKGL